MRSEKRNFFLHSAVLTAKNSYIDLLAILKVQIRLLFKI